MDTRKIRLIFLSCWAFFLVLHLVKAKPRSRIDENGQKRDAVAGDGFYLKDCNTYYDCDYGQTCSEEFHICVPNINLNSVKKRDDVLSRRSGYFPISECYSDYECDYGMKCNSQFGFCIEIAGVEGR